jgi:FkbM family methyltransferase
MRGFSKGHHMNHADRLSLLRDKGFNPSTIYDIGAFIGDWSSDIHKVFKEAQFFLFEANPAHAPGLQKLPFHYFIATLGDQERQVDFFSNNGSGDSIFRERTAHYLDDQCEVKQMSMTTLQKMVQDHKLPLPDLIKLDAQGAEKIIMEGGISIVCHAEAIVIEVKVIEYNRGAPLFYEIVSFMDQLGYRFIDILEFHYLSTKELNEIDLLFLKKESQFILR